MKKITSLLMILVMIFFVASAYSESALSLYGLGEMETDALLSLSDSLGEVLATRGYILPISTADTTSSDYVDVDYNVFKYTPDKWNLYIATLLSDSTIKIENWYRFDANDPHKFNHDVLAIKTDDGSTDFAWVDEAHTAFTITISDERNFRMKEPTQLFFSIDVSGSPAYKHYSYTHDQWDMYVATMLSKNAIKIENWYRFDASDDGDPFEHDHDVCVLAIGSGNSTFEWIDDLHTGFTVTMKDEANSRWSELSLVSFSLMQ